MPSAARDCGCASLCSLASDPTPDRVGAVPYLPTAFLRVSLSWDPPRSLKSYFRTTHGPPASRPITNHGSVSCTATGKYQFIQYPQYPPVSPHRSYILFPCAAYGVPLSSALCGVMTFRRRQSTAHAARVQHEGSFMIGDSPIWCAHRLFTFGLLSRSSRR